MADIQPQSISLDNEKQIIEKIAEQKLKDQFFKNLITSSKQIQIEDVRKLIGIDDNPNIEIVSTNSNTYDIKFENEEDLQKLMYNIVIFHYLIEMKIFEIEKVKLDTLKDKAIIVKLIKEVEQAIVIKPVGETVAILEEVPPIPTGETVAILEKQVETRKPPTGILIPEPEPPKPKILPGETVAILEEKIPCPEITLKIKKKTIDGISKTIDQQDQLLQQITNINNQIKNTNTQAGGQGNLNNNAALDRIREYSKGNQMINNPLNITEKSEKTYQEIQDIDEKRAHKKILHLNTTLNLNDSDATGKIQEYVNKLFELVKIYKNLHLIFVNQVELLLLTMKTGQNTIDEINNFLIEYRSYIKATEQISSQGGTFNPCEIQVPNLTELQNKINEYENMLNDYLRITVSNITDKNKLIEDITKKFPNNYQDILLEKSNDPNKIMFLIKLS
jgi:hypothetical protein